jgi:hypothetical protein
MAMTSVFHDARDDFAPDAMRYEDLKTYRVEVARIIDCERPAYRLTSGLAVEIPKGSGKIRKTVVLDPYDRIVLQGLIQPHAEVIDHALVEEAIVPGYRWDPERKTFLKDAGKQHSVFRDVQLEAYQSGYQVCLIADVRSYYDYIQIDRLTNQLLELGVPQETVQNINQLFKFFSGDSPNGIPQNLEACSLLANLYLSPVDRLMLAAGFRYSRWMDDFRIFVCSFDEATRAIELLVSALGEIGLSLNEKTDVVWGSRLSDMLTKPEFSRMSSAFEFGFVDIGLAEARRILAKCLGGDDDFDVSDLRRCLKALGRHRDSSAVQIVLAKFQDFPELTREFVDYLVLFPKDKRILGAMSDILRSSARNSEIPSYQEAWALTLLSTTQEPIDRVTLDAAQGKCFDRSVHWSVRTESLRLLGLADDPGRAEILLTLLNESPSRLEKRAVMLAVRSAPRTKRNQALKMAVLEDPRLAPSRNYVVRTPNQARSPSRARK